MARKTKPPKDDEAEGTETRTVALAGHNNESKPVSGKRILAFINSIEALNVKKDDVLQTIREEYANAKAVGYDGKTIRQIIKERKMDDEKRREQRDLLQTYKVAIGMIDDDE